MIHFFSGPKQALRTLDEEEVAIEGKARIPSKVHV
jgi:hypothetical protein